MEKEMKVHIRLLKVIISAVIIIRFRKHQPGVWVILSLFLKTKFSECGVLIEKVTGQELPAMMFFFLVPGSL